MAEPPDERERGALWTRFVTRPADTRALGRLRQGVALLAGLASLAVWLGRLPLTVALVATLGALAALAWWRMGTRDVRRADADPDGLWLHARGLWAREKGETHWLPWSEVTGVRIEEELLRIHVQRRGRNALVLASHYPGCAIEEVARTLARAADVPDPYGPEVQGSQSARDDLQ